MPGWKNSRSLVGRSYFRIYGETEVLQTSGLADKTFCLYIDSYYSVYDLLLRAELEGCFLLEGNRFWSDAVHVTRLTPGFTNSDRSER